MHPEASGISSFSEISHSSTSPATSQLYLQCFGSAVGPERTYFSQTRSFSLACSQVPKELLCPSVPGHERSCGCVRQPGKGAAGSTSSRAGVQIEQVFGPEAIRSPILPAAVGSLLVEMEHMLHSIHPML